MKLGAIYTRIDLVFDRYFADSLKEDTRKGRGLDSTFIFDNDTSLPEDMVETFMKNSRNKNALGEYLAAKMIELHGGPQLLICTLRDSILCSSNNERMDLSDISIVSCQSEEADQRLIRHSLNCLTDSNEYRNIVVRTIDTDVLILLISYISEYFHLCRNVSIYAEMINSNKVYDVIAMVTSLGRETCMALPFFYAFTGCDTVSSFYLKGKCKAWDVCSKSQEKDSLTNIFGVLGNKPSDITSEQLDVLERYVLDIYSMKKCETLGQARKEKFQMSSDNDLRKLPPGRDALMQHTKRACYQAGYIWRESFEDFPMPNPELWGWIRDENGHLIPHWEVIHSTVQLEDFILTCSSQKCKNCKCFKANVNCIAMCGCGKKCAAN